MRRQHKKGKRNIKRIMLLVLVVALAVVINALLLRHHNNQSNEDFAKLDYEGEIAIEVNDNIPLFTDKDIKSAKKGFEAYSKLDSLGRCGAAEASVCVDTMPAEGEKRTSLGSVDPSGWQHIGFWCRCHLIGWQLTAENANEENLISGTTRMNMSGMLPYENSIASYIEENPGNHVLYRVEPVFEGNNLIASGLNLQAESVEDKGKGVSFNVYVFNYQPGYIINYKDGKVGDDPEHQTSITIEDKSARYTGEPVKIDEAKVEGSSGDIRYIYYTDAGAKQKTTEEDGSESNGSTPRNKGTYYVRAVVSGDNWYPMATSNVAELTIE